MYKPTCHACRTRARHSVHLRVLGVPHLNVPHVVDFLVLLSEDYLHLTNVPRAPRVLPVAHGFDAHDPFPDDPTDLHERIQGSGQGIARPIRARRHEANVPGLESREKHAHSPRVRADLHVDRHVAVASGLVAIVFGVKSIADLRDAEKPPAPRPVGIQVVADERILPRHVYVFGCLLLIVSF